MHPEPIAMEPKENRLEAFKEEWDARWETSHDVIEGNGGNTEWQAFTEMAEYDEKTFPPNCANAAKSGIDLNTSNEKPGTQVRFQQPAFTRSVQREPNARVNHQTNHSKPNDAPCGTAIAGAEWCCGGAFWSPWCAF